jgi:hypothetical protein
MLCVDKNVHDINVASREVFSNVMSVPHSGLDQCELYLANCNTSIMNKAKVHIEVKMILEWL